MTIEGNHEIEEDAAGRRFLSYTARYRMPSDESNSPSQLYYSFNHGGTSYYTLLDLVDQRGECVSCATPMTCAWSAMDMPGQMPCCVRRKSRRQRPESSWKLHVGQTDDSLPARDEERVCVHAL